MRLHIRGVGVDDTFPVKYYDLNDGDTLTITLTTNFNTSPMKTWSSNYKLVFQAEEKKPWWKRIFTRPKKKYCVIETDVEARKCKNCGSSPDAHAKMQKCFFGPTYYEPVE